MSQERGWNTESPGFFAFSASMKWHEKEAGPSYPSICALAGPKPELMAEFDSDSVSPPK